MGLHENDLQTMRGNWSVQVELQENDVQTIRGNWSVRWDSMKMMYKLCEETGVFGRTP